MGIKKKSLSVKIRHWLFWVFAVLLIFSYFYKDSYKNINNIDSESVIAPIQTPLLDEQLIKFNRDGYSYTLTPIYDYNLSGLVLHTQKYDTWYSLSRTDKTFTKDICVIWGDTLKSKSYRDKTLDIKQDFRFCLYNYYNNKLVFNADELSNNHLIAANSEIEKEILAIGGGDQIRIKGKLVNVEAYVFGKVERYEPVGANWKTSFTREDNGAGACEIIYVEHVKIIKQGHPVLRFLFNLSLYGLGFVIFWAVSGFFVEQRKFYQIKK